jgi:hypothetical protein
MLIERLVRALRAEEAARRLVAAVVRRQARLLRDLGDLGMPASTVAHRVAAAQGISLPLDERLRFGARLRKRRWRGTRGPGDLRGPHRHLRPAASPCDRALPPVNREEIMAHLIRRTVEEVYAAEAEDFEKLDEVDDAEVEEEEGVDEEDDRPAKRKRRR